MSEISSFWDMVQSRNEEINIKGYKIWGDFLSKYPNYKQEVCKAFSKKFSDIYSKTNFHDFHITEAGILECKKKKFFKLVLLDEVNYISKTVKYELLYENISDLVLNYSGTKYELLWSNDIFERLDNGLVTHRIMCTDDTYMVITFEKIKIIRTVIRQ